MKFWGGEYYEDKLSVVEYIYPLGGGGGGQKTYDDDSSTEVMA